MKKILKLFLATGVLFSMASCNLDQMPPMGPTTDHAYTMEYCKGLRAYMYGNLLSLHSGAFYEMPDIYADTYSALRNNGNNGAYMYWQQLSPEDQDVTDIWGSFFSIVSNCNYAIMHMKETLTKGNLTNAEKVEVEQYIGEMQFTRAYVMHRAALLFCQDYGQTAADKNAADAKAKTQMGLPYLTEWNPEEKLGRGTLYDLYVKIGQDVTAAENAMKGVSAYAGAQNAVYLTLDAVTAFRAQLALHTHDYANAITYAQSLYGKYPLVNSKVDLETMWFQQTSTENILQLNAVRATMGAIAQFQYLLNGTWSATQGWDRADLNNPDKKGAYVCRPYWAPEGWLVDLFAAPEAGDTKGDGEDGDFRRGIYITDANDVSFRYIFRVTNSPMYATDGVMVKKFLGDKVFMTNQTLSYRTLPKMFRVAEMYLIEAEAQYRLGGDAATPLNTLRASRGLQATTIDIFQAIQNERSREMIGEGRRLSDIKRWNIAFTRDGQSGLLGIINSEWPWNRSCNAPETVPNGYLWPIPQQEMAANPKMEKEQNPGY